MNPIRSRSIETANEEAIYNIYIYLAHKTNPADNETLRSVVEGLEEDLRLHHPDRWSPRDIHKLLILRNAIDENAVLAKSKIGNLTRSKEGLTACSFTKPNGDVSVVFRGTGSGEWIDNGEGLSGIPEENTYINYGPDGREISRTLVRSDHATDQQVEALNHFNKIAAENGWNDRTVITVSGHSKGGNKAQFITIHSDQVDHCYSFDGQGFSSEALASFKAMYGTEYEKRRRKIMSFSAENDYVNALGRRLVPDNQVYYFKSSNGLHYLEAILDKHGRFLPRSEQGKLSRYAETVSDELMNLEPWIRQHATLGIMNLFQRYLGEGTPVNGDAVSLEKTIAGIGITIGILLDKFRKMMEYQ